MSAETNVCCLRCWSTLIAETSFETSFGTAFEISSERDILPGFAQIYFVEQALPVLREKNIPWMLVLDLITTGFFFFETEVFQAATTGGQSGGPTSGKGTICKTKKGAFFL